MFGKKEKPENSKKEKSKKPLYFIILVLLGWWIYNSLQTIASTPSKIGSYKPSVEDFQKSARERLDDITKNIPEIEGYACEDDDCRYVVYFDFKTIPSDLEMIIRGNTATFSNFEKTLIGSSHVTFAARFNKNVVLSCRGDNGITRECK